MNDPKAGTKTVIPSDGTPPFTSPMTEDDNDLFM